MGAVSGRFAPGDWTFHGCRRRNLGQATPTWCAVEDVVRRRGDRAFAGWKVARVSVRREWAHRSVHPVIPERDHIQAPGIERWRRGTPLVARRTRTVFRQRGT